MKTYQITPGGAVEYSGTPAEDSAADRITFLTPPELPQFAPLWNFPQNTVDACLKERVQTPKLEIYDRFTFGAFTLLHWHDRRLIAEEISFFLTPHHLCIVSRENCTAVKSAWEKLCARGHVFIDSQSQIDRLVFLLLDEAAACDMLTMEKMQAQVVGLEEQLLYRKEQDIRNDLFQLRKDALFLQDNMEHMLALAEDLVDNENRLIDVSSLRCFKLAQTRYERLERNASTLRDSVTQLRELIKRK